MPTAITQVTPDASVPKPVAVIAGAGVIGLTAAHELRAAGWDVHIVARDLPSDVSSKDFASPWAGANWCSYAGEGEVREQIWERTTFERLTEISKHMPKLVTLLPFEHICPVALDVESLWYKDLVPNFSVERIHGDDGRGPARQVLHYDSLCIDVPNYTTWLVDSLLRPSSASLAPVSMHRANGGLRSVREAPQHIPTEARNRVKLVINATALGSKWLEDVKDEAMVPARGITVTVHAPHVKKCFIDPTGLSTGAATSSGSKTSTQPFPIPKELRSEARRLERSALSPSDVDGAEPSSPTSVHSSVSGSTTSSTSSVKLSTPAYIIPRGGSGDLTLGGTFDVGWDTPNEVDDDVVARILRDAVALCPELGLGGDVDGDGDGCPLKAAIRTYNVGQRPVRLTGARVEHDKGVQRHDDEGFAVLHAYGFGPAGYQQSWGVAADVVKLAEPFLHQASHRKSVSVSTA